VNGARLSAEELIETLGLEPHPEGGHYRETWRGEAVAGRSGGTAIYFLLRAGEVSHWHRVDAVEMWHHYAGDPLELGIARDGGPASWLVLGPDIAAGERPQLVVPAHAWQAARPLGAWTLVGCTVVPGFDFTGFELAPPGWSPEPSDASD
jgi:predicted cupin superfamily sugar epimerase